MRIMRGRVLASAALLLVGTARAENNHQPYPIGPRASGMGGAYTALADDAAGVWYNPAAPSSSTAEQVSLSTSIYGFVGGVDRDALGKGLDYSYNNYNVIPTSVSTLVKLGKSRRWSFTINLFTPGSYEIEGRATTNGANATLFRSTSDKLLMVGAGFSYRINSRVAFGAVLYGIYHQYRSSFDLTDIVPLEGGGVDLLQFTQSEQQLNFGYTGAVGLRWEPTRRFFIGLAIRLPSGMISGSGESFRRFVSAIPSQNGLPEAATQSDDVTSRRILPARFSVGLGYQIPRRFAIGADVTMYMPHTYDAIYSDRAPELIREVRHQLTVNAALGIEGYLRPNWPLRLGAYTDFSSSPDPIIGVYEADKINLFGGTIAFGKVGEENETVFGFIGAAGPTKVVGFDFEKGSYEPFVSEGVQWRLFLVYSGSFSI